MLAIPAAAQKGAMGHHSSGFGQPNGQMRADKDAGTHNPDKDKPKKKKKKRDKDQDRSRARIRTAKAITKPKVTFTEHSHSTQTYPGELPEFWWFPASFLILSVAGLC